MTTVGPAANGQDWTRAWTAALAGLELDVESCERLLHSVHAGVELPEPDGTLGSWVPPASIGPLPETLQERARTLLARQLEVVERLATAATRSRREVAFADKVQAGRSPAHPVYVDTTL